MKASGMHDQNLKMKIVRTVKCYHYVWVDVRIMQ